MTPMKRLFKRLMQRFQVEGTEEREKKFIVSYGVGEVIVDTDINNVVACAVYRGGFGYHCSSIQVASSLQFKVVHKLEPELP